LVGGDFNLSRFTSDKINGKINLRYADCFNDWVNKWGLIEISPLNRKFTWANNQKNLMMAKLDRIFISTEWEKSFPLVRVLCLPKSISDHTPLLVDSGENCTFGKKRFRFEKWWLERSDFRSMVERAWSLDCSGLTSMDRWQNKIRYFRRLIRGCAANVIAELNRHKQAVGDPDW
jgi:hypothetical protein